MKRISCSTFHCSIGSRSRQFCSASPLTNGIPCATFASCPGRCTYILIAVAIFAYHSCMAVWASSRLKLSRCITFRCLIQSSNVSEKSPQPGCLSVSSTCTIQRPHLVRVFDGGQAAGTVVEERGFPMPQRAVQARIPQRWQRQLRSCAGYARVSRQKSRMRVAFDPRRRVRHTV